MKLTKIFIIIWKLKECGIKVVEEKVLQNNKECPEKNINGKVRNEKLWIKIDKVMKSLSNSLLRGCPRWQHWNGI